jgi:hypothetical protein
LGNSKMALKNIKSAIKINKDLDLPEFKEKFAFRKAKALSITPHRLQEALDELNFVSNDPGIKDLKL